MAPTESELLEQLAAVEDPVTGEDVVSMKLVNDLVIEDGTAKLSLAFNTPFAPAEMELGEEIRDVVEEAGLEPDLRARVGEELGFDEEIIPNVKNIVAVASGKGGVGKTTVAANLAAGLRELGARVGVLDADVHGPNVPSILPLEDTPRSTPDDEAMIPPTSDGVAVMSFDSMLDGNDPAILRGPMVQNVMMDFVENVRWGNLDYMIVDLPPGTGDASLNLVQTLPVNGVVIVTTPQQMAVDDARKGLQLFDAHDAPLLGVVENMSTFHCPSCGDDHDVFGSGEAQDICEAHDIPLLADLPVHPAFDSERSEGPLVRDEDNPMQADMLELTETIADRVGEVNRLKVREALDEEAEEADAEEEAAASDAEN